MGPIDFSKLWVGGIVVGVVAGIVLCAVGFGVWWLVGHLAWVS